MSRGRLIFPMLAQLHRLDTAAMAEDPGYDPDFREPVIPAQEGEGPGTRERREHSAIFLRCQVEPGALEAMQMHAAGNAPQSKLGLVFHFRDLERAALVDADGYAQIRPGDRLGGIYDLRRELIQAVRTPPGLYVTEARPIGWGLGSVRPRRNLLLVTFNDRQAAARRYA